MKKTKPPPAPPPRNRHERRKAATQARQKANREAKKPRWHHGPTPVPPTEIQIGKSLTVSVADEAEGLDFSGAYLNLGPDGFSIGGVREKFVDESDLRATLDAQFSNDPHAKAIVDSMSKPSDEEA